MRRLKTHEETRLNIMNDAMNYDDIAPMTPFPIPLTTPPETTMYLVIVNNEQRRDRRVFVKNRKFWKQNHAPRVDARD